MRNYYAGSPEHINAEKMEEEALFRLNTQGQESTIHYHKFNETCAGKEHKTFLMVERPNA